MSRASIVAAEIEIMLQLLRQKMKERGFSQLRVQAELGWKGSYISQIFNKTKSVRIEQILMILNVIGVPSRVFFDEYFHLLEAQHETHDLEKHPELAADEALVVEKAPRPVQGGPKGFLERFFRAFVQVRALLRAIVYLLIEKKIFTVDELEAALDKVKKGPTIHPPTWSDEI